MVIAEITVKLDGAELKDKENIKAMVSDILNSKFKQLSFIHIYPEQVTFQYFEETKW